MRLSATNNLTTPRLLLREMTTADASGILALDADPAVLQYLPNAPISTLAEAQAIVTYIRQQYANNGVGRWAVVRRDTGEFIGWCGVKLVNDATTNGRTNYYDLGYRLLPRHWGLGYASEAAQACLRYAFEILKLPELNATVMQGNAASCKIVEKLGLTKTTEFVEADGSAWYWYSSRQPEAGLLC